MQTFILKRIATRNYLYILRVKIKRDNLYRTPEQERTSIILKIQKIILRNLLKDRFTIKFSFLKPYHDGTVSISKL
jgi:hypothetical protein